MISLLLLPLFAWACVRAISEGRLMFLFYAAPAVAMLALHAIIANHFTRYNLIMIGPYAVGAAWILPDLFGRLPSRSLLDSLHLGDCQPNARRSADDPDPLPKANQDRSGERINAF